MWNVKSETRLTENELLQLGLGSYFSVYAVTLGKQINNSFNPREGV